jgi:hypothetical protein
MGLAAEVPREQNVGVDLETTPQVIVAACVSRLCSSAVKFDSDSRGRSTDAVSTASVIKRSEPLRGASGLSATASTSCSTSEPMSEAMQVSCASGATGAGSSPLNQLPSPTRR